MNDPIKTTFKYDHTEDKVILNNVQDIQPIIELNKKEQNNDSMYGVGENAAGMRKVASIPLVVIEKWKRELGVDIMNKNDWPKIKQLLNDPENRFLGLMKANCNGSFYVFRTQNICSKLSQQRRSYKRHP